MIRQIGHWARGGSGNGYGAAEFVGSHDAEDGRGEGVGYGYGDGYVYGSGIGRGYSTPLGGGRRRP